MVTIQLATRAVSDGGYEGRLNAHAFVGKYGVRPNHLKWRHLVRAECDCRSSLHVVVQSGTVRECRYFVKSDHFAHLHGSDIEAVPQRLAHTHVSPDIPPEIIGTC